MILPLGTNHHDGRIGIVSLSIVVICFIVHLWVTADNIAITHATDSIKNEYEKAGKTDSLSQVEQSNKIQQIWHSSVTYKGGLVYNRLTIPTLFTSQFIHSDWLHLLGNMWFFYIVGVVMERYWGQRRFLFAYLLTGVLAGLGFFIITEMLGGKKIDIPLVGASGAISGIMGAFWKTCRTTRIKIFYKLYLFIGVKEVSSTAYLGFYFLMQLLFQILFWKTSSTAYMAHIVGFVSGAVLGTIMPANKETRKDLHEDEYMRDASGTMHRKAPPPKHKTYSKVELQAMARKGTVGKALYYHDKHDTTDSTFAWHLYTSGEYLEASREIESVIQTMLKDPVRYLSKIEHEIDLISRRMNHLRISSDVLELWAMDLSRMGSIIRAVTCYELAAMSTADEEKQYSLRYRAAILRIEKDSDIDEAIRTLQSIAEHKTSTFAEKARQRLRLLPQNHTHVVRPEITETV